MSLYLKHQLRYLFFLNALFVWPLVLFILFSPYQEPRISYVFLVALILSQYVFSDEKSLQRKSERRVVEVLKKDLGRVPSKKEINKRANDVAQLRSVSIAFTAILIILVIIFI